MSILVAVIRHELAVIEAEAATLWPARQVEARVMRETAARIRSVDSVFEAAK